MQGRFVKKCIILVPGFMLKDACVLLHDVLTIHDDHLLWQTVTENHADVYEPEHLAEMYVSLEYSICRYYYLRNCFRHLHKTDYRQTQKNLTSKFKKGVYIHS